jgi:hypothetical protein
LRYTIHGLSIRPTNKTISALAFAKNGGLCLAG